MYDLVVKGGTVLAPGDQLRGRLDIAIAQGKVARIAPDIHEPARRVVDVRGALVTPGLIDLHTHIDFSLRTEGINARGVDPGLIGIRAGVTTVVDAGTTGPYIFGGFRNYVTQAQRLAGLLQPDRDDVPVPGARPSAGGRGPPVHSGAGEGHSPGGRTRPPRGRS